MNKTGRGIKKKMTRNNENVHIFVLVFPYLIIHVPLH